MPGFVIHLAIGKKYIEKHPKEIIDEKQFMKGIIAPDLNEDMNKVTTNKSKTHYGDWGICNEITNINEFLQDQKVNIEMDYWKGYFLHLLADHYFYNIDFCEENYRKKQNKDTFFEDYDYINKELLFRYQIEKIDSIEKYMNIVEGKPKYLKSDKIIQYVEKMSSFNINEQIKIIEEKGMEGLK